MKKTVAPNRKNSLGIAYLLPLTIYEEQSFEYERSWGIHEILVPSDLGGRLRVGFGKNGPQDPERRLFLHGSNGVDVELASGEDEVVIDFAPGTRGDGKCWASVKAPAGKYSIRAHFEEQGFARDGDDPLVPWNFWFYPYAASRHEESAWGSPDVRPLAKYEEAFGVAGATDWERAHHDDPDGMRQEWEGHCHNGAAASILFVAPPEDGLRHRGVHFTCEELKFLATEFFGSFGVTDMIWRLPAKDRLSRTEYLEITKPMDDPAAFGKGEVLVAFLDALRTYIRDRGEAVVIDLRDGTGNSDAEVWNHAVFRYVTRYAQPVDDLFVTKGHTTLYANIDEYPEGGVSTGMPAVAKRVDDRVIPVHTSRSKCVTLQFTVRFRWSGGMTTRSADNSWGWVTTLTKIGYGKQMHAPRWILRIVDPLPFRKPAADGNERIDPDHVRQLLHMRGATR